MDATYSAIVVKSMSMSVVVSDYLVYENILISK